MFDVILGLIAGIVLILIVPALLPARFNNIVIANAVRGLGVLVILFSIGLTSFVYVPDGHLGQLFRVYGGGSLREGKIVAASGENGPQA
jgi:hypothetical protein